MSKKAFFVLVALVALVVAVAPFGRPVVGWLMHKVAVLHGRH